MKTIPDRFRKNGWNYALLKRTDEVALYAQFRGETVPESDAAPAYEVVIVGHRAAGSAKMGGVDVRFEESETLPSNEDWGRRGWTSTSWRAANDLFADKVATFSFRAAKNCIVEAG